MTETKNTLDETEKLSEQLQRRAIAASQHLKELGLEHFSYTEGSKERLGHCTLTDDGFVAPRSFSRFGGPGPGIYLQWKEGHMRLGETREDNQKVLHELTVLERQNETRDPHAASLLKETEEVVGWMERVATAGEKGLPVVAVPGLRSVRLAHMPEDNQLNRMELSSISPIGEKNNPRGALKKTIEDFVSLLKSWTRESI